MLDVGQCGFDHGNISRLLTKDFGADVVQASTSEEAVQAVRGGCFNLVLINRILDADGASGLDLIQQLKSHEETRSTPVALISNYPEAQEAAVALGARRGFGKDALTHPESHNLLASILGHER